MWEPGCGRGCHSKDAAIRPQGAAGAWASESVGGPCVHVSLHAAAVLPSTDPPCLRRCLVLLAAGARPSGKVLLPACSPASLDTALLGTCRVPDPDDARTDGRGRSWEWGSDREVTLHGMRPANEAWTE